MEKCLITTLDAVVNDRSIPYFDTVKIWIHNPASSSSYSCYMGFSGNKAPYKRITQNSGETLEFNKPMYYVEKGLEYPILENPYIFTKASDLTVLGTNSTGTKEDAFTAFSADLDDLVNSTKLKICALSGSTKGDVASLKNCTQLERLILGQGTFSGDIVELSVLTNLTHLRFGTKNMANFSAAGAIEDLFEGLWSNGKRGELSFRYGQTNSITFNGNVLSDNSVPYMYISFYDNNIFIYSDEERTEVLASFDGNSWTYN